MQMITRKKAKALGLKRYFTGKPCKRGHIAERTTCSSDCIICLADRQVEWNAGNRENLNQKSREWYAANKEKAKITRADWRARNYDKFRADVAAYQAAHKEELAIAQALWVKNNPDKIKAIRERYHAANEENIRRLAREWAKRNKPKVNAKKFRRIASQLQATPSWADHDKIREFYVEAERLTRETGILHHVDHIVPIRSPIVCGLHCQFNLQVLPAIENQSKGNRRWPDMPGELEELTQ